MFSRGDERHVLLRDAPHQPPSKGLPVSQSKYENPRHARAHRNYEEVKKRSEAKSRADKRAEGEKHKSDAAVLAVVGFFFLGIVFGPMAIATAKKAEALNTPATLGRVLGWIDVIVSAAWIIGFFIILKGVRNW
jgi:hypothetical protein